MVPPVGVNLYADGDVDGDDLSEFMACVSGPAVLWNGDCAEADFDHDGDVDQTDFGILQRCHSGANKPTDALCAAGAS